MSGDSSVALVSRYRRRSRCSAEVVCLGSPISSNWLPRLRISMARRCSIRRKCSSNCPHRLAKRRASKGSRMKRWGSMGAFKVVF
ncbi:hypothetical protein D9M71_596700 [compost metagenome]